MKKLMMVLSVLASITSASFAYGQGLGFQPPSSQSTRYSDTYSQGFRQGEWDARNNREQSINPSGWMTAQERRDYAAGYRAGYEQTMNSAPTTAQDRLVYRQGVRDGRRDAQLGRGAYPQTDRWRFEIDRRDYVAGYRRGYQLGLGPEENVYGLSTPSTRPSLIIHDNRTVTWDAGGLLDAQVFVKMDNNAEQLFARSPWGTQDAPWIEEGHLYVFSLRDMNGRELARQRIDLRAPSFWRSLFGD